MSFLSLGYVAFLPVVFIGYWALPRESVRWRNLFLLGASWLFYGWSEPRFLAILVGNSVVTFTLARWIGRSGSPGQRKWLMIGGVAAGAVTLLFFKYCNFFHESFRVAADSFGLHFQPTTLKLILPLGISYFTFKSISYIVEVYRGKFKPTDDLAAYCLYTSFFPQVIAGPIDRPANLLNQILAPRSLTTDAVFLGAKQGLWGLFKKVVVADQIAVSANWVFSDPAAHTGGQLWMGAALFAIQIYCDFSGYTDMANGAARMLGFTPLENFTRPYFSRDAAEFWRRWHISLTSWFRDYVFYPLGGGLESRAKAVRNTLATFALTGLWHGSNWTYVCWGLLNGIFLIPIAIGWQKTHVKKVAYKRHFPRIGELGGIALTFGLITLGWILFRSESIGSAADYYFGMASRLTASPHFGSIPALRFSIELAFIVVFAEWIKRESFTPLDLHLTSRPVRWLVYSSVVSAVIIFGKYSESVFLYAAF